MKAEGAWRDELGCQVICRGDCIGQGRTLEDVLCNAIINTHNQWVERSMMTLRRSKSGLGTDMIGLIWVHGRKGRSGNGSMRASLYTSPANARVLGWLELDGVSGAAAV